MKLLTGRQAVLAGVGAVLLLGVAADRFGLFSGSPLAEADGPADARSLYLARAAVLSQERRLLDQADEWRAAQERAKGAWTAARARVIPGKTIELAEARFRDRVLEVMKDLNLTSPRATSIKYAPADAASPVRMIGLRVEFDASAHRDVYTLIDRLENLPDARTNIAGVKIDGPGRIQTPQTITVSLTLQALAAVGEEG